MYKSIKFCNLGCNYFKPQLQWHELKEMHQLLVYS